MGPGRRRLTYATRLARALLALLAAGTLGLAGRGGAAAEAQPAATPPALPAPSPAPVAQQPEQLAQPARLARPDDAETAFNAAFAASLAGRPAEAERRYREVETRFPESSRAEEAAFYRALLLIERGETAAARELLTALAERQPPGRYADDALFRLAELHEQRLHEFARALELYDRLARDFPASSLNSSAAYQAANIFVYNDRNFPEAQRRYEVVREQAGEIRPRPEPAPTGAPPSAPPRTSQAVENQQARRAWLQAEAERRGRFLQEHRDHGFRPLDQLVRAQEAAQAGRTDEARRRLRELRASFPDSAVVDDALFAEAELERLAGAAETAVGLYEALVRDHADSPQAAAAAYQLGEYYRFVGREPEARAAYQAAAARGAGSRLGERAAARLAELELDQGAFRAQKLLRERAGQQQSGVDQMAVEQRLRPPATDSARRAEPEPTGPAASGGTPARE